MQPWPSPRVGVQTEGKIGGGRRKPRFRASGDRLFFVKCAEGKALSRVSDRHRMAETRQRGSGRFAPRARAEGNACLAERSERARYERLIRSVRDTLP